MVKGVSRQVVVVQSPDPKMFDQAIFILKDGAAGITDEMLLKEATRIINRPDLKKKIPLYFYGPVWAAGGAVLTGLLWLFSAL